MSLNVAVQMDPIERINVRGDSTFAILLEAQVRGHALSYYTPDRLALRGASVTATVQPLQVRDTVGDHFTLGEPRIGPRLRLRRSHMLCFAAENRRRKGHCAPAAATRGSKAT